MKRVKVSPKRVKEPGNSVNPSQFRVKVLQNRVNIMSTTIVLMKPPQSFLRITIKGVGAMNERLQLYLDNVEKIRLYFGVDGEKFAKRMAIQLTLRGIRFYYHDYEEVQKHIKVNTKWYSTPRSSIKIGHAYYVQFAKEPEKVVQALKQQSMLPKPKLANVEDSYIAAIYIKDDEHVQKMNELKGALAKQPSLKYSTHTLSQCALLTTRSESAEELATTYKRYYSRLIDLKWKRGRETYQAAFLLTMGTGTFDDTTWDKVKELATIIQTANSKLEPRHYSVVCLLALAKFEVTEFPALNEIHDEICKVIKANPKYENTLLIATQIYTSNEAFGDLPKYDIDFIDMVLQGVDDGFGGDGGDGGGGGGD